MSKDITISNNLTVNLLKNVENYAKFVSQVLHDETFLVELDKTLPFDKMVHATMNIASTHTPIKKMGVSVMRMDIEPPLYSMAVTLQFKGRDGVIHDHSVFINACKTIEELQQLVTEENFKQEVLSLCEERVLENSELQEKTKKA